MITFKEFLEMWDSPGKQGEAATPLRKPSDGQPFKQFARGGKPRGNSGGGGSGPMGSAPAQFMKKR